MVILMDGKVQEVIDKDDKRIKEKTLLEKNSTASKLQSSVPKKDLRQQIILLTEAETNKLVPKRKDFQYYCENIKPRLKESSPQMYRYTMLKDNMLKNSAYGVEKRKNLAG